MSDPVVNVEIEDVLSSIRRLVTEENRGEPAKVRLARPDTGNDRLVLTPALRVPETEEAVEASDHDGSAGDHSPTGTLALDSFRSITSEPAEPPDDAGTAETDAAEDWSQADEAPEAETANLSNVSSAAESPETEATYDGRTTTVDAGVTTGISDEEAVDEDRDDAQDPPWKNRDSFLFQAAQLVEKTDAVKKARLETEDDDDDPETLPQNPESASAPVEVTRPGDVADTSDETLESDAAAESNPEDGNRFSSNVADKNNEKTFAPDEADAGVAGEPISRTASLSAKIEALEAAIAETQDQWEPDGQVGDDYAGTPVDTIEWHDDEEDDDKVLEPVTQFRAHPRTEPAPVEQTTVERAAVEPVSDEEAKGDSPETQLTEETILDEESLRELVADIVRQELQGALGERITRNVRKLVRREIHRALTAQELE